MNARRIGMRAVAIIFGSALLWAAATVSAATSAPLRTATTTRVSVSSAGKQGGFDSYATGISADGRYVVINSQAPDLVAGDTNERWDVFVRDRGTGRTTRASVDSKGRQAKAGSDPFGGSTAGGISADGRYVVFTSDASNLVAGDTNGATDVFVRDRKLGRTIRVSLNSRGRQANGYSGYAAISPNGRYVAFSSGASNLVPGDTNKRWDVFVRDLETRRTTRVSVTSRGKQTICRLSYCESIQPAFSADGRYVSFESSFTDLVPGDTNRLADVFVRDRLTGKTTRVSVTSRGGQGRGRRYSNGSNASSLSADGRFVAFHSDMLNLVPRDTNNTFDIFVHDRVTGRTERVSVGNSEQQANGENLGPASISADGRYVAFTSLASNLVAADMNDITDVFIRDRRAGRTIIASLSTQGKQGEDSSAVGVSTGGSHAFSANNRYLAFSSWAPNLVAGDTNAKPDAFVRDFGGPLGR